MRATIDPNAARSDSVRKLLDLALAAVLRTEMPGLTAESLCAGAKKVAEWFANMRRILVVKVK